MKGTLLGLVLLAGCAPKAPVRPPEPAAPPAPSAVAVATDAGTPSPAAATGGFPAGDSAELVGDDRAWHARAREAVARGDLYLAKRILLRLVAGYRREPLFVAQHEWVQRRIDEDAQPARLAMKNAKVVAVPALPSGFRVARAANVTLPMPKLTRRAATKNAVTDEDRWFASAGPLAELALPPEETRMVVHVDVVDAATDAALGRLTLTGWLTEGTSPRLRNAPFPSWIPSSYGTAGLRRVILSDPYTIVFYGERHVFVFDGSRSLVRALDVLLFQHPESHVERPRIKVGELTVTTPEGTSGGDLTVANLGPRHDVQWAQARDGVLYLSTRYNGYAKDVAGKHAWVVALDLGSGDVLFRSPPLVANGANFLLVGGAVVTGYGFSGEPDFVYTLDARNGSVLQKLPVPSSPEAFAWNEPRREILVRTYDHDLVFAAP